MLDVRSFGAVGDKVHDDTAAIQAAIDEAARTGETVYIGPGNYSVGVLYVRPAVYIRSDHTWGFGRSQCGRAVLWQRDNDQPCLLDVTEAADSTLDGLSLMGTGEGKCVGILSRKTDYGRKEDSYRIENCRVAGFGSHAVYLDHIWCFSVRHCMFCFSGGDGLVITGWDGFVIDNWLSGNKGSGFGTIGPNCSVTLTGNRIEWNAGGGITIYRGSHYNITGNYIDRAGKAAIDMRGCRVITVTGNILYRSGKFQAEDPHSTQLYMSRCQGISVTGNTFNLGRDDNDHGAVTPAYAIRLRDLTDCVVSQNTLFNGGTCGTLEDLGGHVNCVIRDNVGRSAPENGIWIEYDETEPYIE